MGKKLAIVVTLVIVILTVLLRHNGKAQTGDRAQEVTATRQPNANDDQLKARCEAGASWFDAAAAICSQMPQNKLVHDVYKFMDQHANPCIPFSVVRGDQIGGGLNPMARPLQAGDFALAVFMQTDRDIVFWQQALNGNFFAAYHPDNRVLVLKEYEATSKAWKGIMFLHEGLHAMRCLTEPYDWTDERTFCLKEREAHELQNSAAAATGGPIYQSMLADEVQRVGTQLREHNGTRVGPYDMRFDQAYGPALSPEEQATRSKSIWIHAVFIQIENEHLGPDETMNKQARFLKASYERLNLLPH